MPFSELVASRDCCSLLDWDKECSLFLLDLLTASFVGEDAWGRDTVVGVVVGILAAGSTSCGSWHPRARVCSPFGKSVPALFSSFLKKKSSYLD